MKWTEITVHTTTEAVEAVSHLLYDIGAQGVVIEDPADFSFQSKEEQDWDYIEEEVYKKGFEGVLVKSYVSEEESRLPQIIEKVKADVQALTHYGLDIGEGSVRLGEVDQTDWETAWKQYYKPVRITERITIKPTWEDLADPSPIVISLDPGMAFGTGTHETTAMCLQELEKVIHTGDLVLDVGCGSAILSVGAVKLGARQVWAVDTDPVAVRVAKENTLQNAVSHQVEVVQGTIEQLPEEKADVVVANIIADVILQIIPQVKKRLQASGTFLASGIIRSRCAQVEEALECAGFKIQKKMTDREWCCLRAVLSES